MMTKIKNFLPTFVWLALFLSLFVVPAYAQNVNVSQTNAQQMLVNFAQSVPNLMRLVTAIAYVLGLYFMISALIKLKHFGESRTMMSREHSLAAPLTLLAVGAALIYLPTSIQVGMSTFWTNPNPYGYTIEKGQWMEFFNVIVLILQLIGVIAFIRGMVILAHVGSQGGHQATFGKGLTHIIGGVLLINIFQFVQIIMATLGISFS